METRHQNILRDVRRKIVDDLDVRNAVIDRLKEENVLNSEQVERILQVSSRKERAELLLDILPQCGRRAFNIFHESLGHHYWWLRDGISRLLTPSHQDTTDFIRKTPGRPNLPYPQPAVFRTKQVLEMRRALENLRPGHYLVLHGMEGFGKSSLTTSALAEEEFTLPLFDNRIYWMKLGNESSKEDEISIQLNTLYHRVVGRYENVNSSLNSESLKQHLLNCLQTHMHEHNLYNALLILEDVTSNDIIEAFDLPCKTLVITTDLHILENKPHQIIELKTGFTEQESLGLFAKSLETDVKKLLPEARRIHENCYGMPMLISILAAEFKKFPDLVYNKTRWRSYLNALGTDDSESCRGLDQVRAKLDAIFEMCINKLELDAKTRYEKLVIFSEDVNITPQTLKILWDEQSTHQVDQHMLYLCEKSLAARHHNYPLKSFVYGVHDLLLCYLRKKTSSDELKELHRSFIEKYRKYCNGDFSQLPNDNYIFSYIGHHLEQAGMESEEFQKLYFNFDFLTAKINHSGLSDLLIDLKKYRRFITGDSDEVEAKLVDLEEFLKREAGTIVNHKCRQCLDLVQIGLTCSESGFVAESVCQIANERSSKLYVTYEKRYGSFEVPESLEVMADTEKAVFLGNPDEILIGNSTGEVILLDCETRQYSLFSDDRANETSPAIQKILVSSDVDFFLTLCDAGQVNLFKITKEDPQPSVLSRCGGTPREKQKFWFPIHGDKVCKDSSQLPISVVGETITDMALSDNRPGDKRIGICTSNGTIEVWSIDGMNRGERIFRKKVEKKDKNSKVDENFRWITFSQKSALLQVMNSDGDIRFYTEIRDELITSECYCEIYWFRPSFKEKSFILFQSRPATDTCLVIGTQKRPYYLTWLEVPQKNDLSRAQGIICPTLREGAEINSATSYFTCAALTADGKYLVTGHSNSLVTVWDMDEAVDPIAYFSGHVTSLDTFWLEHGCHLICGSGDRVIHRWSLDNQPARTILFDAAMKPWGEDDIVAKKKSFENTIEIYRGNSMIVKTEPIAGMLTDLAINPEGSKVVYASRVEETGSPPWWVIRVFDIELKETMAIANLRSRPTILRFLTIDGYTIVVYTENGSLKIWYNDRLRCTPSLPVENVINIHMVDESRILTVTPHDCITLFRVENNCWHHINIEQLPNIIDDKMVYSCMAPNVMALAILTANGSMIICDIERDDSVIPTDIKLCCQEPFTLQEKIVCCEYSPDSKYLALGLDSGSFLVRDAITLQEVHRVDFHCHEVSHLRWWPSSIGVPILLSANRDELAWWNFNFELNEKQKNKHNRKRPYRTSQITTPETQGTRQSNADPPNHNSDNQDNINNAIAFWKQKRARYYNRNDLLSVVPLPQNHKMKLCISKDCDKLLFVDPHGSICNLKFFNYSENRLVVSSDTNESFQ